MVAIQLDKFSNAGFDRGASRLKEALWIVCKCLFFLTPWPWPSVLRVMLLRLFGARVGRGVVIRSRVNITFPWRLSVGDYVWIGEEVLILSLAPVRIGSHVCLSQRAFLCTGSHDHRREGFDLITAPICIDDHTWIAAEAFIGPGVHLGSGCVIAASTVVVRDVPERSLVKGNPGVVQNDAHQTRSTPGRSVAA